MKRIIALLLIMLIAVGCESKASADYLWNISVDDIEKVEIQYMDYTFRTKEIELSDGISLINALNKIKRTEVDFEKTNNEPNFWIENIIILNMKNGEMIKIGYTPWPIISYDNYHYFVNMNAEFFDCTREIDKKYGLSSIQWQDEFQYNPYGGFLFSDCIVSVNQTFNEVLKQLEFEQRMDDNLTIKSVLDDSGFLQLNDVVTYNNIELKVIEIIDNEVTAVIFHVVL